MGRRGARRTLRAPGCPGAGGTARGRRTGLATCRPPRRPGMVPFPESTRHLPIPAPRVARHRRRSLPPLHQRAPPRLARPHAAATRKKPEPCLEKPRSGTPVDPAVAGSLLRAGRGARARSGFALADAPEHPRPRSRAAAPARPIRQPPVHRSGRPRGARSRLAGAARVPGLEGLWIEARRPGAVPTDLPRRSPHRALQPLSPRGRDGGGTIARSACPIRERGRARTRGRTGPGDVGLLRRNDPARRHGSSQQRRRPRAQRALPARGGTASRQFRVVARGERGRGRDGAPESAQPLLPLGGPGGDAGRLGSGCAVGPLRHGPPRHRPPARGSVVDRIVRRRPPLSGGPRTLYLPPRTRPRVHEGGNRPQRGAHRRTGQHRSAVACPERVTLTRAPNAAPRLFLPPRTLSPGRLARMWWRTVDPWSRVSARQVLDRDRPSRGGRAFRGRGELALPSRVPRRGPQRRCVHPRSRRGQSRTRPAGGRPVANPGVSRRTKAGVAWLVQRALQRHRSLYSARVPREGARAGARRLAAPPPRRRRSAERTRGGSRRNPPRGRAGKHRPGRRLRWCWRRWTAPRSQASYPDSTQMCRARWWKGPERASDAPAAYTRVAAGLPGRRVRSPRSSNWTWAVTAESIDRGESGLENRCPWPRAIPIPAGGGGARERRLRESEGGSHRDHRHRRHGRENRGDRGEPGHERAGRSSGQQDGVGDRGREGQMATKEQVEALDGPGRRRMALGRDQGHQGADQGPRHQDGGRGQDHQRADQGPGHQDGGQGHRRQIKPGQQDGGRGQRPRRNDWRPRRRRRSSSPWRRSFARRSRSSSRSSIATCGSCPRASSPSP